MTVYITKRPDALPQVPHIGEMPDREQVAERLQGAAKPAVWVHALPAQRTLPMVTDNENEGNA